MTILESEERATARYGGTLSGLDQQPLVLAQIQALVLERLFDASKCDGATINGRTDVPLITSGVVNAPANGLVTTFGIDPDTAAAKAGWLSIKFTPADSPVLGKRRPGEFELHIARLRVAFTGGERTFEVGLNVRKVAGLVTGA